MIAASRHRRVVLLGCLLNLDAVVAALEGADVQIVCAGTEGAVALEDVYVAGRISARLAGGGRMPRASPRRVAAPTRPRCGALAQQRRGAALRAAGLAGDIDFCAERTARQSSGAWRRPGGRDRG